MTVLATGEDGCAELLFEQVFDDLRSAWEAFDSLNAMLQIVHLADYRLALEKHSTSPDDGLDVDQADVLDIAHRVLRW